MRARLAISYLAAVICAVAEAYEKHVDNAIILPMENGVEARGSLQSLGRLVNPIAQLCWMKGSALPFFVILSSYIILLPSVD